ncbi:MAG: carotenoid biosynthesis protein [candidate division WOR-3 bacterium]|nr:carotenoid biosynthesis protein [candidate division WOR-3 bacterium]
MNKYTNNSALLNIGIWFALSTTIVSMVADIIVRPPLLWLTLMPTYGLAVFVFLHSLKFWETRQALWFLALGLILPYIAEYLGTNFGAIFGSHWFARIRDLRIQVGVMLPGRIPLNTVLLWYALLYLVFLTGIYLVDATPKYLSAYSATPLAAAFLITLWQLTAGPVAINRGTIGFVSKGFYHGIPLSNFAGWFATTLFIISFLQAIEPNLVNAARFYKSKSPIPILPLLLLGVSILHNTLLCFRMELLGAAWLGVAVLLLYSLAIAIRAKSHTAIQLEALPIA